MKKLLLSLIFILSFAFILSADTIVLSGEKKASGLMISEDNLFSRQAPSLVVDCHVATMEASEIATSRGKFTYIYIPGQFTTHEVGAPQLPTINKLIEIPFGAEVSVQVISSSETEYLLKDLGIGSPIYPRQPSLPKDGTQAQFAYNADAYQVRGYAESSLATIEKAGILRSHNLALLRVSPIVYNPTENKIKVYNDIKIQISLNGADYDKTLEIKNHYSSSAYNWVNSRVLVPDSIKALPVRTNERGETYLIIAHSMFKGDANLNAFIAWKGTKGFNVIAKYTDEIGTDTTSIKNYITSLYGSATPPTYILFVGDKEQIPAFTGVTSSSHITDLYYATMDGSSDYVPDILYGRFSAQTADQLAPQINKTMMYVDKTEPDSTFVKRAILIAGWDSSHAVEWGWPQINYAKNYYFNESNGYTKVDVYLSAGSGQNVAAIKAGINEGCVIVNYTAHGSQTSWADPGMSISDVKSYNNYGKLPLVIGNCCLTNSFQVSECFGEAWLRVQNGAIGYIGGSNSTYWDEDLWWGNGAYTIAHPNSSGAAPKKEDTGTGCYDSLFTKTASNAAIMKIGNLAVQEAGSSRTKYYWEVYHLMGDPSVIMRFPE